MVIGHCRIAAAPVDCAAAAVDGAAAAVVGPLLPL